MVNPADVELEEMKAAQELEAEDTKVVSRMPEESPAQPLQILLRQTLKQK